MKLELKHLAPYLPYGLKCQAMGEHKIDAETPLIFRLLGVESTMGRINCKLLCGILPINPIINEVFPILRPLSDLNSNVIDYIWFEIISTDNECFSYDEFTENCELGSINFLPIMVYDFLLSEHFDVFGLIEKGLAIDINTLK